MTPPLETVATLTLGFFGPFTATVIGQPLPRLRSPKGRWLLALLALRHPNAVDRSWVSGMLWPDSDRTQALANLRNCLTDLRKSLGAQSWRLVSPTSRTLKFDLTGAAVDLFVFDEAVARKDLSSLTRAVALYRGPLLESCTEEWVFQERAFRERAYLTALETLAADANARGDFPAALGYLRRTLDTAPLSEIAHRSIIRILAAGGDYAAATQTYRNLRDLFHRELHAEPAPETTRLYQTIRDEAKLRAQAKRPSPISAEPSPCRLPHFLTPLIGRHAEVQRIEAALAVSRLVTLTGPGGVGKTRLGVRAAEQAVEQYSDGAWFVDLAPLSDATLVPDAVAEALEVRRSPEETTLNRLIESLRERSLLLVLDNCERLIKPCADLAVSLLKHDPELRILATSRQPLNVPGESVIRISPLTLPECGSSPAGEALFQALEESEAASLFVERARSALPMFRVTDENAKEVAQVCIQLDGIPLALELAAARVRVLSVEQIVARLSERFRLLIGGRSAVHARHQTLRATMDWSHELLSEAERLLFRRLSVFSGGFTLESTERVCVLEGEQPDVLEGLQSLMDKSLIHRQGLDEPRFAMLEMVREYATEELQASGESAVLRRRHAASYWNFAWSVMKEGSPIEWPGQLEWEQGNFRAALAWCKSDEQSAELGLDLATTLAIFWKIRGCLKEGRDHIRDMLSLHPNGESNPQRPWALVLAGLLAFYAGDIEEARRLNVEQLKRAQETGDRAMEAYGYLGKGHLEASHRDWAAACFSYETSLKMGRELEYKLMIVLSLRWLAGAVLAQGDYHRARSIASEGLAMQWETKDLLLETAYLLREKGLADTNLGDWPSARSLFEEAARIQKLLGDYTGIPELLGGFACLAIAQGEIPRAVRLFGAAEGQRKRLGSILLPHLREEYDRTARRACTTMEGGTLEIEFKEGSALTLEQAILFALEMDSPYV